MAVTISNIAARQPKCNTAGEMTWGDWSTNLGAFWGGSYNANNKNIAQCRFQVDKPCSQITLHVCAYSSGYTGTVYWAWSLNENDETLGRASYNPGVAYQAVTIFTDPYQGQNITISGTFPANTPLYLYGFHYAPGEDYACVHMYALFDSNYYTKVIDAVEIQGAVYIYNGTIFELYLCYIYNGTTWDLYLPYIYNGSSWDMCG